MKREEKNLLLTNFLNKDRGINEKKEITYYNKGKWLTELRFDTKWGLLFQVVDKLKKLGYDVVISRTKIAITYNEVSVFETEHYKDKQTALYLLLIDFVTLENKKNELYN